MKLSEAFNQYIQIRIIGRGCSPRTIEYYRQNQRNTIKYFGDIKISKITPDVIAKYYVDLVETTLINGCHHAPGTARREIYTIKSVLGYWSRRGVKTTDIEDIEIPREQINPPRWLERYEVEEFIDTVCRPCRGYPRINIVRNELIMRLLFCSGIRVSELVALNRDSIRDGQFVVTGKSKEPRVCFITPEIGDLIDKYLEMRDDDNPALFVSSQQPDKRITTSTVRLIFRRNCRRCGIKGVHPHTMRHSFATYMIDNGADIRQVATLLGHQNIQTTERYTHIKNEGLRQIHMKIMAKSY